MIMCFRFGWFDNNFNFLWSSSILANSFSFIFTHEHSSIEFTWTPHLSHTLLFESTSSESHEGMLILLG
uniref:Putative ovule protein n=1 Tax=Solanum chacoense TaxID=4108 RepID=A0A0V0GPA7_SOLCH